MGDPAQKGDDLRGALGYAQVFSGLGIGLLVGLLVGLSLSPIVGTVLGGLVALLSTFLGLTDPLVLGKGEQPIHRSAAERRIRELRAGSFGLACALGVLLGLYTRTHNLIGVGLEEQYQEWKKVGFGGEEARQLLAYKELGALPAGLTAREGAANSDPQRSVLYTGELAACVDLSPEKYSDVTEVLNAWDLQGGPWQAMAREVRGAVAAEQRAAMVRAAWRLACSAKP